MFQPAGTTLASMRDGHGLNPLLRHPGMIIHPPMLYLGFVSFVIPFAFAIAALVTGRTDDRWIRLTRRWTLVAWLFLSLGLLLGGRWAYDVLGWGGYWGWDPVEIAAFMPWLTGTAFLHSVMIQEKRGMLKHWNMVLIILTYCLVIFGTFLTRSGVLSSVHAFAQSAIGPLFFGFIGLTFIISLTLLLQRWDSLKSEAQMTSMLSREALFLLNNLLFMSILVVCFWGVIFPLISELFTGQKVTVGPPFYERATGPLFAGLLLLMGIAPLSAWRHSTAKTLGRAMWKPFIVLAGCRYRPAVVMGVRSCGRRCSASGCALSSPRSPCTSSGAGRWPATAAPARTLPAGAVAPGRAQPPPLWRLHHPPGRGADGDWHHRHRDVPDRDPGHDPAGRLAHPGRLHGHLQIAGDLRYPGWAQCGPRRAGCIKERQAVWPSCTHAGITSSNPSSR